MRIVDELEEASDIHRHSPSCLSDNNVEKPFFKDENLLAVVSANSHKSSMSDLIALLSNEREEINNLLLSYGAVMFRGYKVNSSMLFKEFCDSFFNKNSYGDYTGGNSPRFKVADKIYTSTYIPEDITIGQHLEMSYTNRAPEKIVFCCVRPSEIGGYTPLTSFINVYNDLDQEVRNAFEENNLVFTNCYLSEDNLLRKLSSDDSGFKSWQESFQTDDVEIVKEKCRHLNITVDSRFGKIFLSEKIPALIEHPKKLSKLWYACLDPFYFTPRYIGMKNYLVLRFIELFYRITPRLTFENGKIIPARYINHVLETVEKHTRMIPWQCGDVLVVDNLQVAHGRTPYHGEREILTSFC